MAGNDAFQVQKPRSMIAGARNVLRTNDSASLWNCTLSPGMNEYNDRFSWTLVDQWTTLGWSQDESETLRKALMKFGIGNWSKIIESGCLPGKTNAQMNLQLQRLLGQQSTAGKVYLDHVHTEKNILMAAFRVCRSSY